MNKKTLFFICSAWPCLILASHHKNQISEFQEFRQPAASWFAVTTTQKIASYRPKLVVTCCKNTQDQEFEPNVYFKQDESGVLVALYNKQFQHLGHFPHLRLQTDEAMTEWYNNAEKIVKIIIPYTQIIIDKPL